MFLRLSSASMCFYLSGSLFRPLGENRQKQPYGAFVLKTEKPIWAVLDVARGVGKKYSGEGTRNRRSSDEI
jgi:hypothetical protein